MKNLFTLSRRRRSVAAVALAAVVGLTLAACGSSSSDDSSSGGKTTITLGYFKGGAFGAQVAQAKKYFAAEGLDVKFQALQAGPAILQATALKRVDIGYGDTFAWASAIGNGFDNVKLIAPANTAIGWLYATKGITSAKDLVGKKIGVTPTPFPAALVKNWLTQNGVDPSKVTLTTVQVGSQAAALKSGSVSAVFSFDFVTNARLAQVGGTQLADVAHVKGVNLKASNASYYANTTFLKAHPAAVKKFVTALRKAGTYFNGASAADKAKYTSLVSGVDLTQLSSQIPGLLKNPTWTTLLPGALDTAATQNWVDLGVQYKVVPKPVDITSHLYATATSTS